MMRARLGAALVGLMLLLAAAPTHADPLPTAPGGIATIDSTCTPAPEHPRPVVLLHDIASTGNSMGTLARYLAGEGWCVFVPTYGRSLLSLTLGGMADATASAAALTGHLEAALAATGADQADLVAHGAGSLVAAYALQHTITPGAVANLVSVAPLWNGTNAVGLGYADAASRALGTYKYLLPIEKLLLAPACAICTQVITHSDFTTELAADGLPVPGVRMTNLVTKNDELVWPPASGLLEGAQNYWAHQVIPGAIAGHFGLIKHAATIEVVRHALG